MAWYEVQDLSVARDRAQKIFAAPIGLMSPLWFAFGAAASAGVTWWLMTRWAAPVNVEAMFGAKLPAASQLVEPVVIATDPVLEPEAPAEPIAVDAGAEPHAVDAGMEPVIAATLPEAEVAEPEPLEVENAVDDLTLLAGVGPKLAKALADRGVTQFGQLAAWTVEELAAFDTALKLNGRALRADFIGQAKRLVEAAAN